MMSHASEPPVSGLQAEAKIAQEDFPWDAGIFDAHCHPTDTMASIRLIPSMKARALATMATRGEDQELVAQVAQSHDIQNPAAGLSAGPADGRVIPAFGWHPWFSHQLYDDFSSSSSFSNKVDHYSSVLHPSVVDDAEFIAGLPEPLPLSGLLAGIRERLSRFPRALVGEVGLDKAFRLPSHGPPQPHVPKKDGLTPGGREGRLLSPYRVKMNHQVVVLKAQLALAGELRRPVSVHGVQAHGVLHDALGSTWCGYEKQIQSKRQLKRVAPGAEDWTSSDEEADEGKLELSDSEEASPRVRKPGNQQKNKKPARNVVPYPPRICLHSFSGPPQMAKQYLKPTIPAQIFFSFSAFVNMASPGQEDKTRSVLEVIPHNKILVESDFHAAGEEMDDALEKMYRFVCEAKGWALVDGVQIIRQNFQQFICGCG